LGKTQFDSFLFEVFGKSFQFFKLKRKFLNNVANQGFTLFIRKIEILRFGDEYFDYLFGFR